MLTEWIQTSRKLLVCIGAPVLPYSAEINYSDPLTPKYRGAQAKEFLL